MFQLRAPARTQAGRTEIHLLPGGEIRIRRAAEPWRGVLREAGAASLLVLVALCAWFYGEPSENPAVASAILSEKREAFLASRTFVGPQLPGGRSAQFPPFSPDGVEWLGAGRYAVDSFVELLPGTNDGRRERQYYTCVLARTPEGRFCLESLTMEDPTRPAGYSNSRGRPRSR
ncbi:MAG: hypothetical protein KatS3mg024_0024 [Armatimonadota bacterium]|nr:MAG: hypothetical protein KatS3mg024_0024 [Armatimonadota bacterium]